MLVNHCPNVINTDDPQAERNAGISPFLRLPVELWNKIWTFTLRASNGKVCYQPFGGAKTIKCISITKSLPTDLRRGDARTAFCARPVLLHSSMDYEGLPSCYTAWTDCCHKQNRNYLYH